MMLGAVLAGGKSTRFGRDKALVEIAGRTLLEHAVAALAGWCDEVVVLGRETAPAPTLPDWPAPGMGPLGGLAAALRHGADRGYSSVLSCGVDSLLPAGLPVVLGRAPAYLASQPVIGLWPTGAAGVLEGLLHSDEKHSMRRFAELVGARRVEIDEPLPNINTPEDLDRLAGGGPAGAGRDPAG